VSSAKKLPLIVTSVPIGPNVGLKVTKGTAAETCPIGRLAPSKANVKTVEINLNNLLFFKLLPPGYLNCIAVILYSLILDCQTCQLRFIKLLMFYDLVTP
jgi:hypothetical protein